MDNGASSYLRFLNGDDDAFAPIVRDYKDGLILYIDSFIHNLSIAEDLMEDTFVKLATKRPVFHNDSAFKTWLYAIARNLALDWCRQNARQRVVSVEELSSELTTMDSIELQYLRSEQRIQLHKALRYLGNGYALRLDSDSERWHLYDLNARKTLPNELSDKSLWLTTVSNTGFVVRYGTASNDTSGQQIYSYIKYTSLADGLQEEDLMDFYSQSVTAAN